MGLVVGRNYVWYLVIVVVFIGFGQVGAKRCGGMLKSHHFGVATQSRKRGALFLGKAGSHYLMLLLILKLYFKPYWV